MVVVLGDRLAGPVLVRRADLELLVAATELHGVHHAGAGPRWERGKPHPRAGGGSWRLVPNAIASGRFGGIRAHSWPPCAQTLQFSTALEVAGLASWTAGQDIGVDDSYAPMRGRYRSPRYRRLSHGLMMRQAELGTRDERLRDLAAWRLVLPPDAVFTRRDCRLALRLVAAPSA